MKNKRTCIPISGACNSNCIFCMDNWSLSKFISIEEINAKLISAKKYSNEVTFSSLEPTLHPNLLDIIKKAKELGFSRIEIVTNGRKLKDYVYTENLVKSGINEFDISIHHINKDKHDFIVQSKGAFDEGISGLINVCKLSKKYNIKKTVSVTVCKQNYNEILKIVYFLEKFGLDSIVLNILQPRHSAVKNKDLTFVNYSKMLYEFLKLKTLQHKYNNIYINGLVPCLEENLKEIIGYFNGAQINNKDDFGDYKVEFNSFKVKSENCNKCKYFNICDGVWESYIDEFGWNEFNYIK